MKDEIVQYIIVNNELKMSKGKTAAQSAHVTKLIVRDMEQSWSMVEYEDGEKLVFPSDIGVKFTSQQLRDYDIWMDNDMTTIVLQAEQWYLEHLIGLDRLEIYHIRDSGRTQIEPNSLTVVGLIPMRKSEAKKYVGGLKLL